MESQKNKLNGVLWTEIKKNLPTTKAKVNKKEFDMRFTLFDDDSIDGRKILFFCRKTKKNVPWY